MLPSSVRRVVSSAPHAAVVGGLAPSLATSAPKAVASAAASNPFIGRHQRRCSSSKPSRSDNDASGISAGQSVPATPRGHAKAEGKTGGDKRKRKADREAAKKLPSVPNTHHMVGEALGLSSFFSLHRPISITQTMPKSVTEEQFASIFAPRTKANKVSDAMSTLSSTIDQLEGPMASMTIDGQHEHHHHATNDGMQRMEIRNPDGTESSIYLQVDAMSGDFFPFRPPPIPQPQPNLDADASAAAAEAAEQQAAAEETPQHRAYKAMFTIEETTEPDGQIRIVAHSPHIMQNEEQQPRSFLERLAQRQLKFDEARGVTGGSSSTVGSVGTLQDMYGISVRRQRKLRMKKKKYKKLMKRTRNLRRKLDRT